MDNEAFKKLISYLESSGGTQMNHQQVQSGPQKGTKAMGEYALMPKTAQELARHNIQKGSGSELDKVVAGAAPKSVQEVLEQNPDKYNQYINQMSENVMDKSKGNPEEAAMRWLAGPNSSQERLNNISAQVPGRVEKIQDFMNQNPGMSEPEPYTSQLLNNQPEKEILYNKIRAKLAGGGMP